MRYLKSWLFRIGLTSTLAGVAAAFIVGPTEIRWASSGAGASDAGFFREYADYDVLPPALTLSGLVMMAMAIARTEPRKSH
jgi:hypothetical protein